MGFTQVPHYTQIKHNARNNKRTKPKRQYKCSCSEVTNHKLIISGDNYE